jgi:hypothetical protein
MKVQEILLEAFCVFGPRHLIDTRRGGLLQSEEARSQNVDGEVMQERRQLVPSVPDDGFSYAGLRL